MSDHIIHIEPGWIIILFLSSGDSEMSASLKSNVHVREPGRSLLWVDEDTLEAVETDNLLTNMTGQCGGSGLNQTESIRMESDLRGWFNVEPPVTRRRPDVTRLVDIETILFASSRQC